MLDYDLVKEIKNRADIVDVISSYLPSIQKRGKYYETLCPFHDDHDPSLKISKDKQTFNCYVCQTGGDVIAFVQKYEKCSFEEAVRKICEIIGFDDPRLHKKSYERQVDQNLVPVYNCITDLQKFYEYGLTTEEGKIARDYLDKRQISSEQRQKFGLGYALKDGSLSISYLKNKGYSLKNIQDTGISLASTLNMNDNNAGRLIFPIKDMNGQVVGFSARRLYEEQQSKYVNSPDTPIFLKGNVLYNINNAKSTARHDGYIYLVEGFMDVFAFDTIGITSCVALMSTKLTSEHIKQLKKLNCEIRLCLDGDKAGQSAMMQIMTQLEAEKLSYRLVMKEGELRDPDEILKQDGPEALKLYVSTLVDSFTFALNYYKNYSPLATSDDKKKVIYHFAPMLRNISSKLERDDFIYKLSEVTNISPKAIKDYVETLSEPQEVGTSHKSFEPKRFMVELPKEQQRLAKAERIVLDQMLIGSKEAISFYKESIKFFVVDLFKKIANYIMDSEDEEISVGLLMDKIALANPDDKEYLVSFLASESFVLEKISYNPKILEDCKGVIDQEKMKIHEKNTLLQASEGKTAGEKARLLADYINRTNK